MLTKECNLVQLKTAGDDSGQFEALVSVFGNKDSYGDVVMPGAFTQTLAEWKASGRPIPVFYSHRIDDPEYNLGYVVEAKEIEATSTSPAGLWVKGQLRLSNSKAKDVLEQFKDGTLAQFSFAYDVREGGYAKSDALGDYYELRNLKLYEVGPTVIGANQETELLSVKALDALLSGVKAGRVLSAKNETTLRGAYDAIGQVLAALDDSSKDAGAGKGKTEEPGRRVNVEDPAQIPATLEHEALDLELELA